MGKKYTMENLVVGKIKQLTQEPNPVFSGSRVVSVNQHIQIGCMSVEARELLDIAIEKWQEHVAGIKEWKPDYEESVYSFAYWLFRWSGLVQPAKRE